MESNANINILLVDDRTDNLVALETVLGVLGHNLVTATSGREALKRLLEKDFAVILLDVQMPEMDGFETAELIRARVRTSHTPIIFLTAINKSETHVTRGYSVGAVDYVFKPFDPEVLRGKVSAFVELWKKTRELEEEIAQRKIAEDKLDASNALLETISRALVGYIGESDPRATFDYLLQSILTLTRSEYGFIGELAPLSDGGMDLRWCSAASIVAGPELCEFLRRGSSNLLEIYHLAPLSGPRQARRPFVTYRAATASSRWELPEGHPPLETFLGLPFYKGETLVGMVGVANRAQGYGEALIAALEPFLNTCAIIMEASRNDQRRRQAEDEVRDLNNDLELRVEERTAELEATNRKLEREITERKRAEEARTRILAQERSARAEAEAAQKRLRFLGEASAGLAISLDYETTLDRVAHLPVPYLADFCLVDLIGEDGQIHRVATAHVDPSKNQLLQDQEWKYSPETHSAQLAGKVLLTGESQLQPGSSRRVMEQALDDDHLNFLGQLGARSHIAVPLVARGQTIGALSLGCSETRRQYGLEDLALAEDLARRAAAAIDNATLFSELQDAARRKDVFLAMLAHELRNPLAAMSNADYALGEIGSQDARVKRLRSVISRQTRHLARLVDDLLDISRITSGKIKLKPEPMEVRTLVEQALDSTATFIEARGHRLSVTLPPDPVWIEADATRMEQVLSNLLQNAAKYTEPGGQIWLTVTRDGEEVVFRVHDSGIGISADLLPYIFDLFTQSDRSLDRSQGGLGIGLALVRNLVQMHQGRVSAQSAGPGKGSEFVIRLPALPSSFAAPEIPHPDVRPLARPVRVLVVEDNVDAAETLTDILELWGHKVRTVHTGTAAVEEAARFEPEVVLLDIGLPGMDGYEVARQIRRSRTLSHTLLVAMTGYGQGEDQRLSREAGFDVHLTKPVAPEELQQLLTHLPEPAPA